MKALLKSGQIVYFDHSSQIEEVILEMHQDQRVTNGKVAVYIKECPGGEAYFISSQPITASQSELRLLCEGDEQ